MSALCIFKNDTPQLAAELIPAAALSFSLSWIGNTKKEIVIDVTRADDLGSHRWNPLRFLVGDSISFITTETNKINGPIESFTAEDLDNLQKSKPLMKPEKRTRAPLLDIGDLDCQINNKHQCSFHLNTDNLLLINFVWVGDRSGMSMMHISLDGSSPPLNTPKIEFGDEVTFSTTAK